MSIDAVNTVPADEVVMKEKKQKKEKKDKKRKLAEAEPEASTPVEAAVAEEKPKKKSKKSKTAPVETAEATSVASTSATPAPTDAAEAAAPLGPDGLPLSKKQQKKMAKAAAAAAAAGPAAPSVVPTPFNPEHTAFLTENGITLTPHLFPPILSLQGANLPVSPKLLPYLSGFTKPTPIQSCSWPPLLAGRDVIGVAETGSGKTLSFSLPVLHALSQLAPSIKQSNQIKCLVLAPTRELALQTHATMQALGALVGVNAVCLFGGVGKDEQVRELRKQETRIVVGTPGRTLDLADQGEIDFSCITHLVLDEADRMLDAGFENDIRRIVAHCPGSDAGRQTVMFSATWPESVRRLASTFLVNPVKISVGSDELTANKRINQVVEVFESSREKDPRLLFHLRNYIKNTPSTPEQPTRILVFALYKKEATRLEQTIKRAGHLTAGLHGDLDQGARFKALDAFKTGKVNVLVATDVAARGLDIPDVGLVINVTFPLTTEDFVHRCGRTGRAGKSGKAVTFFTGENHERSLAGEFMRVLRDAGCDIPKEMDRFPSTIKKKEHGSYGAFYRDTTDAPAAKKITFD